VSALSRLSSARWTARLAPRWLSGERRNPPRSSPARTRPRPTRARCAGRSIPVAGTRPEHQQVAAFVGHHSRARRIPGQMHGTAGSPGKRAADPVGGPPRQPDRAAKVMGSRAFPPPLRWPSADDTVPGGHELADCSRSRCPLVPVLELSRIDLVAPMPAHGMISAVIGAQILVQDPPRAPEKSSVPARLQRCHVGSPRKTAPRMALPPG